jgi:hypothetical protein
MISDKGSHYADSITPFPIASGITAGCRDSGDCIVLWQWEFRTGALDELLRRFRQLRFIRRDTWNIGLQEIRQIGHT